MVSGSPRRACITKFEITRPSSGCRRGPYVLKMRAAADRATGAALNAIDPTLTGFRERGGKLILFHGWSDPAIAAGNSINYYESGLSSLGSTERESGG